MMKKLTPYTYVNFDYWYFENYKLNIQIYLKLILSNKLLFVKIKEESNLWFWWFAIIVYNPYTNLIF